MLKINGTTITLTRGDTLRASLEIADAEGNTYTPSSGDVIRFAMKKSYSDSACLIEKQIPNDTLQFKVSVSLDEPYTPQTYYAYEITNIQANHVIVVSSSGETSKLYLKVNGAWTEVEAYKKVNGTWVKQTESPFDTNTHYRKG